MFIELGSGGAEPTQVWQTLEPMAWGGGGGGAGENTDAHCLAS